MDILGNVFCTSGPKLVKLVKKQIDVWFTKDTIMV